MDKLTNQEAIVDSVTCVEVLRSTLTRVWECLRVLCINLFIHLWVFFGGLLSIKQPMASSPPPEPDGMSQHGNVLSIQSQVFQTISTDSPFFFLTLIKTILKKFIFQSCCCVNSLHRFIYWTTEVHTGSSDVDLWDDTNDQWTDCVWHKCNNWS